MAAPDDYSPSGADRSPVGVYVAAMTPTPEPDQEQKTETETERTETTHETFEYDAVAGKSVPVGLAHPEG